jgi:hypothetical protein
MAERRPVFGGWAARRGLPPMVQRHPVAARPIESASYRLLILVGRPLWAYRTEAAAAALVLLGWCLLARVLPGWAALLLIVLTVAGALAAPVIRRRALGTLGRGRLLRGWESAARHAGLATLNDRIPKVRRVEQIPAGELLRVRVADGGRVSELEDAAEVLAAMLEVREVKVTRDRANARYASVAVIRRDPLAVDAPRPWPLAAAPRLSLWDPIPVGVDEQGRPVTVRLVERNLLLGGEPGAGKSVAQSLLTAAAALDPDAELVLLDGKQVELAPWAPCALRVVGPDVAAAVAVLDELRVEMDARYEVLLHERRRKVSSGDGLSLRLVVIDELAFYLSIGERKEITAFATGLRDLVSRGRAAGIIVVAATQKPAHDIVPTGVRDLFAFRWALRCTTPQASDTILGSGWASLGYSAADVDAAARGVGYLLAEGGEPTRLRSYHLDDAALGELAARAAALRASTGSGAEQPAQASPMPASLSAVSGTER